MDERERRVVDNEALFREVNERIGDVTTELGIEGGTIDVVCECGDAGCAERITVALADYDRVRRVDTRFLLVPGHELPDVETVVDSGDGWIAVEKRGPGPRDRAREAARDS